MKTYEEQAYKHSQSVRVTMASGDVFEDEIKGLNQGHALYLAKLNWDCLKVEAI